MKLHFRKIGKGRPMVILHGLYGSSDNWLSIGRKLSDEFEVFLVDQRNHGKSPHDRRHDYGAMSSDLLEFLDDRKLDRIILAGHSMGGKTAMCFAGNHPSRIEKLVIVDIAPKSYSGLDRDQNPGHFDIMKAMKEVDFSRVKTRSDVDRMLSPVISSARIRSFLLKNLGKDSRGYYWMLNIDVLFNELDSIMDGLNRRCLDHVSPLEEIPVLFIRGERSPYVTDGDMEAIKEIFPLAELKTVPAAGHWLHAENPGAFIEILKEFAAI